MTELLPVYLNRLFVIRVLAAAAALMALLQILELMEVTTEVLERGLGVGGVLRYAALRLPSLLPQVLPLSVLIGAALTLAALAGRSEITALRAVGVSLYRLAAVLLPATLAVAAVHLITAEMIAPRTEAALTSWWARSAPPPEADEQPKWFRIDRELVSIGGVSTDGRRLTDLRVYARDSQGRLASRLVAPAAEWSSEGWTLRGATATAVSPDGASVSAIADRLWRTPLTPEGAVNLFRGTGRIAARAAQQSLSGRAASNQSTAFYATRLNRTFAEPLAAVVMLLLAAPVALAGQRGGKQALWLIGAVTAGLVFMLVDGLMTSFGQTGVLPAALGAWAAPVLGACTAAWALLKIEG